MRLVYSLTGCPTDYLNVNHLHALMCVMCMMCVICSHCSPPWKLLCTLCIMHAMHAVHVMAGVQLLKLDMETIADAVCYE